MSSATGLNLQKLIIKACHGARVLTSVFLTTAIIIETVIVT